MELHSHHHKHLYYTGHPHALPELDAATQKAVEVAIARAETALKEGRLLSPGEALALAGPVARSDETLFSIARTVAEETNCSQAEILGWLGEKFPTLS